MQVQPSNPHPSVASSLHEYGENDKIRRIYEVKKKSTKTVNNTTRDFRELLQN